MIQIRTILIENPAAELSYALSPWRRGRFPHKAVLPQSPVHLALPSPLQPTVWLVRMPIMHKGRQGSRKAGTTMGSTGWSKLRKAIYAFLPLSCHKMSAIGWAARPSPYGLGDSAIFR